jgi:esterase/lipase
MTIEKSKIHFIFVAGFSADDEETCQFKDILKNKGYSTESVNFYGEKYIDDFSGLKISDCLANIAAVIERAAEKYDFVYGIGISLGGALLLEHAKSQNNLGGIVSIGTPIKLRKKSLIAFVQKILPLIYPVWRHLQKIKQLRLSPIGAGNIVVEFIENDLVKNLEKIKTPTLFLHSKKDRVSDFSVLPQFCEKLSSEKKQIELFENGKHVINNEKQMIIKYTLDFLGLGREGLAENDKKYLADLVLNPKI